MKVGNVDKHIKRLARGMAVTGLIFMPVFGCGKSEAQDVLEQKESEVQDALEQTGSTAKTVVTPEQIDVNSILEDSSRNTVDSADDVADQDTISDPVMGQSTDGSADDSQAETSESDLSGDPSVDVDLTALSATMVYSEVFQMMYYPENYIGKTVKMEGMYDHYHDDATGKDYYACIIQDATACCAQGIEFQLSDGDYPADTTDDVMVKGTFETYEEDGAKYCTLVDAELVN